MQGARAAFSLSTTGCLNTPHTEAIITAGAHLELQNEDEETILDIKTGSNTIQEICDIKEVFSVDWDRLRGSEALFTTTPLDICIQIIVKTSHCCVAPGV